MLLLTPTVLVGLRLRMEVRDIIRRLESSQWKLIRQKGSHRTFKHPNQPMVVTVPGHWNDDLPLGTLKSILKKALLEES